MSISPPSGEKKKYLEKPLLIDYTLYIRVELNPAALQSVAWLVYPPRDSTYDTNNRKISAIPKKKCLCHCESANNLLYGSSAHGTLSTFTYQL